MFDISKIYFPLTSTPFSNTLCGSEISPCKALKPFVRCYWTDNIRRKTLVIPDTCMDIIFHINNNSAEVFFCTLDENYYFSAGNNSGEIFGIRFFPWAAKFFSGNSFCGKNNVSFPAEEFFPGIEKELLPYLIISESFEKRAEISEKYLLKILDTSRMNSDFMNIIYDIISSRGTEKIAEITAKNIVSARKAERLFSENSGISPKSFSSLVRYQLLWQELCSGQNKNILDLTEKYGFYDQAHLLNEFKKRHSMYPLQAIEFAKK